MGLTSQMLLVQRRHCVPHRNLQAGNIAGSLLVEHCNVPRGVKSCEIFKQRAKVLQIIAEPRC